MTRITCHVKLCKFNLEGLCQHTSIHLCPCSLEADNVVGCSEFQEDEFEQSQEAADE